MAHVSGSAPIDPVRLERAVGIRVCQLREGVGASRDDLARAAQRAGLYKWDAGRVAHMERGRVSASIPTLIGVASALAEVSGRPIGVSELVPRGGDIQLGEGQVIPAADLRAALAGRAIGPRTAETRTNPQLEQGWGKVDDRLVVELGMSPESVRSAVRKLYGRTATEERDARAGVGATAQKRGRVTRGLIVEVRAESNGAGDPQ